MSYPPTGRDTTIYDGQFTNAQTINHFYSQPASSTNHVEPIHPYRILEANIAMDALFDSAARFDPPKCHPQTRIAILDQVNRWLKDAESPPILWIRGAAGAGKSAIAQTLSERWDEDGSLAATFYFSRAATGRNTKGRLISTLAYQLSIAIPSTRPLIENTIRADPKIFSRNLQAQIKRLVIDPLLFVLATVQITSKVIVIDGLDECCIDYPNQDHEQQQKEILECIQWAVNHRGFPLRFLIASRPEKQIRDALEHGLLKSTSLRIVLDNSHNPAADIELYLRCRLEEIRCSNSHLGSFWPPEDIVTQLVAKSSGHFIYATVVVRYLTSPRMDPAIGLKTIMSIGHGPSKDDPFAEIDALYMHILRSVATESLTTVMDLLRLMIYWEKFIHNPFHDMKRMSPSFVAKHNFVPLGQLYVDLTDLHSILDIPLWEGCNEVPISFIHASFSEFLTQPSRSEEFYIDKNDAELHFLSLSIRHLYIQALCPDCGREDGYAIDGITVQAGWALWEVEPNKEILQALKAFVDQDETEFSQYVYRANLKDLGTARNGLRVIQELYNLTHGNPWRPTVLQVLKFYGIYDFEPIDPEIFPRWKSHGLLDWFCDPNQTAEGSVELEERRSKGEPGNSSTLAQGTFNGGILLAPPEFEDSSSHETRTTQESSKSDPDLPTLEAKKDPGSISEQPGEIKSQSSPQPRSSPLTITGRWASKNLALAQKGTPSTFLRHITGLGLRPQPPISLMSSSRGGSPQPEFEDKFDDTPD